MYFNLPDEAMMYMFIETARLLVNGYQEVVFLL